MTIKFPINYLLSQYSMIKMHYEHYVIGSRCFPDMRETETETERQRLVTETETETERG